MWSASAVIAAHSAHSRKHRQQIIVQTEDFLDFDTLDAEVLQHDIEESLFVISFCMTNDKLEGKH